MLLVGVYNVINSLDPIEQLELSLQLFKVLHLEELLGITHVYRVNVAIVLIIYAVIYFYTGYILKSIFFSLYVIRINLFFSKVTAIFNFRSGSSASGGKGNKSSDNDNNGGAPRNPNDTILPVVEPSGESKSDGIISREFAIKVILALAGIAVVGLAIYY